MCGIAGLVNLDKRPIDKTILEDMVGAERHRGPDDIGFYHGSHFGLGHARLAIIDLSQDAHQPMANDDRTIYIIHNGEIYNYLELREELKRLGHTFRSKSDTEVILRAYEEWGEGCLKSFNGMWAFAIFDLKKKELFLSRDRFGVKPFYYYADEGLFAFASEIKALLRHPKIERRPNDRVIFNYLASGYGYMDISDETFFKGIRQLKGGHYMKVPLNGDKSKGARYWDLDPHEEPVSVSEDDIYDKFRALFEDSIRLRLRSDVALGVSLSGGLDSSSITCVAAGILKDRALETFSSCFEEGEYDERRFIRPVLDKSGSHANYIFTKPEDLLGEIEKIIWHQDEPYSTLSILPQWYVMKLARERGVKVLLTGQGGDETLAGYHKYYLYLFADYLRSLRWGRAFREMNEYKCSGSGEKTLGPALKIAISYMAPRSFKDPVMALARKRSFPRYLDKGFAHRNLNTVPVERRYGSILTNDLYNALKVSPLPSLLHIDDRSSMAHSVESRAPFLDYRLVEYLFSLGPEYKIRNGLTKYILRRSMKGVVPEEVLARRDKMGFTTPLEKWLKTNLKEKVREIITSREFAGRPYFNRKGVLKEFDAFLNGKESVTQYTVWSWINLELWLRKFIDSF